MHYRFFTFSERTRVVIGYFAPFELKKPEVKIDEEEERRWKSIYFFI